MNKEHILSCNDVKIEKVNVPEWNCDIFVRSISAKTQDEWAESVRQKKTSNFQASFLVLCICDESGRLVFDKSDADRLGEKSASVLSRIFDVASKINCLGTDDTKELEKN